MMNRKEKKHLWIMGAALLVVFSGVGIAVSSSQLPGLTVVLGASLVFIVVGLRLAGSVRRRERMQLLIVLFGYALGVAGFAISLFYSGLIGSTMLLIGTLIGLIGSAIIARAAKPV